MVKRNLRIEKPFISVEISVVIQGFYASFFCFCECKVYKVPFLILTQFKLSLNSLFFYINVWYALSQFFIAFDWCSPSTIVKFSYFPVILLF